MPLEDAFITHFYRSRRPVKRLLKDMQHREKIRLAAALSEQGRRSALVLITFELLIFLE